MYMPEVQQYDSVQFCCRASAQCYNQYSYSSLQLHSKQK